MLRTRKENARYLPNQLTRSDKKKQLRMLDKSRKLYKEGVYFKRPFVASFQSLKSPHVRKAREMYDVPVVGATDELAKATGCTIETLQKIIRKGEGAYYSSGSRPNQTPQSWGVARLASALTGGKAGAVDYNELKAGCVVKGSMGLRMAEEAKKKYGKGGRGAARKVVVSV